MEIKIYGDPILRKKCFTVKEIGEGELRIFDEMLQEMRKKGGVGLAACQVGINKQMLVVDVAGKILKLANPKILKRQGALAIEEGCLSLPEILIKVKRAKKINLEAINELNQKISLTCEDILAIVLQHEIDHLEGRLIIDYLPWYKKIKAIRKLKAKKA
ncbi:MAG: peptide deformylase [Candidatus Omnitrophota bacterium]